MSLYVKTTMRNYLLNILLSLIISAAFLAIVNVRLETLGIPIVAFIFSSIMAYRIGEYLLTKKALLTFKFIFGPEESGEAAKNTFYGNLFGFALFWALLAMHYGLRFFR